MGPRDIGSKGRPPKGRTPKDLTPKDGDGEKPDVTARTSRKAVAHATEGRTPESHAEVSHTPDDEKSPPSRVRSLREIGPRESERDPARTSSSDPGRGGKRYQEPSAMDLHEIDLDDLDLGDREVASAPPSAAAVVDYLRDHPDFLSRHPDLLSLLTPPALHRGRGVIDMQQFMLTRLQDELSKLKGQQRTLLSASRTHYTNQARVHAAALSIIGASSFELLIQTVTTDLAVLLDVDVVTLGIESEENDRVGRSLFPGLQVLPMGAVDHLLGEGKDAALADRITGDPLIYGQGAGLVRSEALLRLSVNRRLPPCLLAVGSRRPQKYRRGQSAELLCFLAQVLELTLNQWLDLDP